ncbi:endonuclease [Vairimorpha necatrix]|uniref:Endonuclease n=1 Tax=Vairimorpha necatrix TaxID=6039 RepID=A0AAX4JFW1_9MICR
MTLMITETVKKAMEAESAERTGFKRKLFRCYECGRIGHISRNCKYNRFNKGDSKYLVFKRSAMDHEECLSEDNYKKCKKEQREKRSREIIGERVEYMELDGLRRKYHEVFSDEEEEIKYCKLDKCRIKTEEGKVVKKKGQMVEQALIADTVEHIKSLERRKIIRRSVSEWRNPVRALRKPNGKIRLVSNLMALNDIVDKDPYELARIGDVTRGTQGSRFFTVIHIKDSFYHIGICEEDKHKTAFEFNGRVYEWNSMVIGTMNTIFDDLLGGGAEVYMDDVVIHAKTKRKHDELLKEVLKRFKKNNMKINISKIQFCKKEVKLLGVTLNGEDSQACEIKKNEALEYPAPANVSELRRFLGLTGWFRSFIKDYAKLTYHLTNALKGNGNNFEWAEEMQKEFESLKECLRNLKSLKIADYSKEFLQRKDASNVGMGAVLLQRNGLNEWVPVQWASKKFTPTESRYAITEKEMYAVFWGIKKFEYELRGRKFKIETDHKALSEIRNKANFNNDRINRWIEKIQDFDFTIECRKPEIMVVADSIGRIYTEEDSKKKQMEERAIKQQIGKWKKHVIVENGLNYRKFDNNKMADIPEEKDRPKLIEKYHELKGHRSMISVYYEMKSKYYWPGMKKDIEAELSKCEVCQINNRKKSGGCVFVATSRYLEKVAFDLIEYREEKKYIVVAIDYFTRRVWDRVIDAKTGEKIVEWVKEMCVQGKKPEEIITDNGKEFVNEGFRQLCKDLSIEHRKVSIEAHRSNGRVERVIGTLRKSIAKIEGKTFEERVMKSIEIYNLSYHSGIKYTPVEAVQGTTGKIMIENGPEGTYAKRFVARKREKFYRNQIVRVAKKENLGGQTKYMKGRFVDLGMILEVCPSDSYIVRLENGRIIKKRHYDLKGIERWE